MIFSIRWVLILSFCFVSCVTTPFQITALSEKNSQVKELFLQCSDGINYLPGKPECDVEDLETQTTDTLAFAKSFISRDIYQPQGYDVYLSVAMIYFRIGERNGDAYSEAEKIARQFFETQKASSGRSLLDARFYWASMCSAQAAWRWFNSPVDIDKTHLLLCQSEGNKALPRIESGPRKVRLQQYLEVLREISQQL